MNNHTAILPPDKVYIKGSPGKGMGVFASVEINEGDLIEECHIYFLNGNDRMRNHAYGFPKAPAQAKKLFIAFGFGSIYNHSDNNNVDWECNSRVIRYFATRKIDAHQECCIKYHQRYWNSSSVKKIV